MADSPKIVEINYNLLKELFKIADVKYSDPPTEEELQQLTLSLQEKINYLNNLEKSNFDSIRNIFSIDPLPKEHQANKKDNSILVVDDLVMVTYQLSILLSKIGYQVSLARSAPEAISIFKSKIFKYVLMDLHLPEREDGYYLLRSIKEKIEMEGLNTKIMVMSGIAEASSVEYCLTHGASSFVEKDDNWKKEIVKYLNQL